MEHLQRKLQNPAVGILRGTLLQRSTARDIAR